MKDQKKTYKPKEKNLVKLKAFLDRASKKDSDVIKIIKDR